MDQSTTSARTVATMASVITMCSARSPMRENASGFELLTMTQIKGDRFRSQKGPVICCADAEPQVRATSTPTKNWRRKRGWCLRHRDSARRGAGAQPEGFWSELNRAVPRFRRRAPTLLEYFDFYPDRAQENARAIGWGRGLFQLLQKGPDGESGMSTPA